MWRVSMGSEKSMPVYAAVIEPRQRYLVSAPVKFFMPNQKQQDPLFQVGPHKFKLGSGKEVNDACHGASRMVRVLTKSELGAQRAKEIDESFAKCDKTLQQNVLTRSSELKRHIDLQVKSGVQSGIEKQKKTATPNQDPVVETPKVKKSISKSTKKTVTATKRKLAKKEDVEKPKKRVKTSKKSASSGAAKKESKIDYMNMFDD